MLSSICNVWFDRAAKKTYKSENPVHDDEEVQQDPATNTDTYSPGSGRSQTKKRKRTQIEDDEQLLRNVKWAPDPNYLPQAAEIKKLELETLDEASRATAGRSSARISPYNVAPRPWAPYIT
jgi:hypothetical protein